MAAPATSGAPAARQRGEMCGGDELADNNPSMPLSFAIDHIDGQWTECANGFNRAGGAANTALMGPEYDHDPAEAPQKEERSSFLFAMEVDRTMTARDPYWKAYWRSHRGVIMQFLLIFVYMHFDAGLPILQDLFKKYYGAPTDWHVPPEQWVCPSYTTKDSCVRHACKWKADEEGAGSSCKFANGILYTKQTLLITQNFCEIMCIFIIARLARGSIRDCINLEKTLKFSPAGACFGIQAVFGFFAMEEMGADAYSLYAQTSIIVLTLAWSLIFGVKLSGPVWMGVITIAIGMVGFKMADADTSALGLAFIGLKIATQCFACVYAEMFIKQDPEVLYIQMAWIKPVELVVTIFMTFFMSLLKKETLYNPEAGQFEEMSAMTAISKLGFYHHWNWLTVVIMVFNMGDTFMTATVAKKFDSVVKGVAGVADIIYPTQFLMYFINKPDYTPLMVISGTTIIAGALNFVLAKGGMRRSQARKDEIKGLQGEIEKTKSYSAA